MAKEAGTDERRMICIGRHVLQCRNQHANGIGFVLDKVDTLANIASRAAGVRRHAMYHWRLARGLPNLILRLRYWMGMS